MLSRLPIALLSTVALFVVKPALADDTAVAPPPPPPSSQQQPAPGAETPQPSQSNASETPVRLYAEPAFLVPTGNLADSTGAGFGGFLGVDYRLSNAWQFTARGGYLAGSSTSFSVAGASVTSSMSFTPLLAGAKLYLTGTDSWLRLYGAAEAGIVFVSASVSASEGAAGVSASGSSTTAGAGISAGLELDVIDLRLGLFATDVSHTDASTAALGTLGFRFASL